MADHVGAASSRIDPTSGGTPFRSSSTACRPPWLSHRDGSRSRRAVWRGSRTITVDTDVGQGPSAVTFAFGSIWVANELDASVTRVDPSTGRIQATVPVGEGPASLMAAGDRLWVSSAEDGSLAAIDPGSNSVANRIPVEGSDVLPDGRRRRPVARRGPFPSGAPWGTLQVSAGVEPLSTIDPAGPDAVAWQILSITNDGLVTYRKVDGPDGVTIVPDLAAALPEVSEDGLTYRFPIRTTSRTRTVSPCAHRTSFGRSSARSSSVRRGPVLRRSSASPVASSSQRRAISRRGSRWERDR